MNIKALGTALKNKVTDKVGGAMAKPYVAYKEAQTNVNNRNANFLKDQNAKKASGIAPNAKERAQIEGLKSYYGK